MGRVTRVARRAVLLAFLALGTIAVGTAQAADPVFGTPTASSTFGEGVSVTQPVVLDATPFRVEVLVATGEEPPLVTEVPAPSGTGSVTLRDTFGGDGFLLPNTPVTAQWRITMAEGELPVVGPEVSLVYDDDRFTWQTTGDDVVRVHWYEGSQAFGERALRIGEEAVTETAALFGVTEDEPIDFFIYADVDSFYDALGPGTRENVGGQANADIRTLFALIRPSDIDDPWVAEVVPHELVHLVFDTAVQNPYHFPPRWLNEGLATYLSVGYGPSDRSTVESAARDGSIIPLDGLGGQFPTTAQGFGQAYAESVSAVDFLIRTHGQPALLELIDSYADGRTDDEAFEAAIGQDVAAFDAAWLADLGAEVPVRRGPQPAPPGPQPAAWDGTGGQQPGGPAPAPSAAVPTTAPGSAAPEAVPSGSAGIALLVVLALFVAAGVVLVAARRRGGPVATP
jgi:hypothetical protein